MRKIIQILLLVGMVTCLIEAARADGFQSNTFSATGQGLTINNIGSGIAFHKLTWTKTGTVTLCSVRIDSSTDGISWNAGDVLAAQDCSVNGTATSTSHVVNYTRVNVTSFTGTGSEAISYNLYVNNPSGSSGITNSAGNNVIPKSDGTNIVASSLTDNGTTTTSTTNLQLPTAGTMNFSTDAGISRDAAGVIDVGNGTQADVSGTVKASKFTSSASNGGIDGTEGTGAGLTAAASHDLLFPDSTAHRWKMNNNNGGAVQVVASGGDINTSDQVTVTHLASALPVNQGGTGVTTSTGSTNTVLSTSPLLVTPSVTTINDANGNAFIKSSATASAVDSIIITNAATANPATVTMAPSGTDTNINLNFDTKGSAAMNFKKNGTTVMTLNTSNQLDLTNSDLITDSNGLTVRGSTLTLVGTSATNINMQPGGHIEPDSTNQSVAPTIAGGTCGTSPSITTGSTDNSIEIVVGTGGTATSCQVNFGKTWAKASITHPNCAVNSETDIFALKVSYGTGASVTVTSTTAFTASSKLSMVCF